MAKRRLDPGPFIVPMPLVLVGTKVNGKANFMPAAFVGIVNYNPAVIACGLNPSHHTSKGIVENGEFSINLPPAELVTVTDYCGLTSGDKTDKSELFEVFFGELLHAPMIEGCRLTAECKLIQTTPFAIDTVYFGEIVAVHADEEALTDGKPDWRKIDPLLFTFPNPSYWQLGEYVAPAWKKGKEFNI